MFIPLKEWKQKKLEDIESRMRKSADDHARKVRQRTRTVFRNGGICALGVIRALPFLARLDICMAWTDGNDRSRMGPTHTKAGPGMDGKRERKRDGKVTNVDYWVNASHSYKPGPYADRSAQVPSDDNRDNEPSPAVSRYPNEQDLVQIDDSGTEAVREEVDAENGNGGKVRDEITGWADVTATLGARLSIPKVIPKVGDIVKSIKEVSNALASPAVNLYNPTKNTGRMNQSSGNKSASNETSSDGSTQTETDRKAGKNDNRSTSSTSSLNRKEKVSELKKPESEDEDELSEKIIQEAVVKDCLHGVKEKRYNFASAEAGARILSFSNGVVGAKNVITGNVDKYMLAPCAGSGIGGSRWVDVDLSEDVILDRFETANFEYYSSSARKVAVLGAGSYPPKKWNVLGIFEIRNRRDLQEFQIKKRLVTRYMRVMFAGKQGHEFYCPVSTIRAFGKTLIADWKDVFEPEVSNPPKDRSHRKTSKRDETVQKPSKSNGKRGQKEEKVSINHPSSANDHSTDKKPLEARELDVNNTDNVVTTASIAPDSRGTSDGNTEPTPNPENGDYEAKSTGPTISLKAETYESAENTSDHEGEDDANVDGETEVAQEVDFDPNSSSDEDRAGNLTPDDGDISEDDKIVLEAVRSDTLAPLSGDDNIFRKVTRRIRLLELNQTLTNQYIDTQLAKFAKALSTASGKTGGTEERVSVLEHQMGQIVVALEGRIEELQNSGFRRDVVICVLLVSLAFLIGTQWVLWTAVSGARLHYEMNSSNPTVDSAVERVERLFENEIESELTTIDENSSNMRKFSGRKKKRRGKRALLEHSTVSANSTPSKQRESDGNEFGAGGGRSHSSTELMSVHRRDAGFVRRGGAFDVLERSVER